MQTSTFIHVHIHSYDTTHTRARARTHTHTHIDARKHTQEREARVHKDTHTLVRRSWAGSPSLFPFPLVASDCAGEAVLPPLLRS
jgi:hypothetical protein